MATKKNDDKSHALPWVCACSILSMIIVGFFFQWEHPIKIGDPNYIIDQELLGTYGDFVGGVLGALFTIISAILLWSTLNLQREATRSNEAESKSQRFNDLFFELLHLYQSVVNELWSANKDTQYNNKDFFDVEKFELQTRYNNKKIQFTFDQHKTRTTGYYMLFYTTHRSKIAVYYRTLYRLYDLIDSTNLLYEDEKIRYAKMIRVQLTESELFFIRYNARSPYGKPFIKYINKYNMTISKELAEYE